ncbi:MAG: D-tyrosyl-tRNA(Tyr) deacylase [Cytophagales bacterium]|nr:D-tyrosyl-tRNA(Tyr) deacylase [Cytophagales bacterium]
MIVVVQRVKSASVTIDQMEKSAIGPGLLILLGITHEDSQDDIDWLASKIVQLRIFSDEEGKMNKSVVDMEGEILLVSQFTLFASTKKGNRPSFVDAARPEIAVPLYNEFIRKLEGLLGKEIKTGEFGADMQVQLINDGPVTIIIDSKNKK